MEQRNHQAPPGALVLDRPWQLASVSAWWVVLMVSLLLLSTLVHPADLHLLLVCRTAAGERGPLLTLHLLGQLSAATSRGQLPQPSSSDPPLEKQLVGRACVPYPWQ